MTNLKGTSEFPRTDYSWCSPELGALLNEQRKVVAALRVYHRRGYNDSALKHRMNQLSAAIAAQIDREESDYLNPPLF